MSGRGSARGGWGLPRSSVRPGFGGGGRPGIFSSPCGRRASWILWSPAWTRAAHRGSDSCTEGTPPRLRGDKPRRAARSAGTPPARRDGRRRSRRARDAARPPPPLRQRTARIPSIRLIADDGDPATRRTSRSPHRARRYAPARRRPGRARRARRRACRSRSPAGPTAGGMSIRCAAHHTCRWVASWRSAWFMRTSLRPRCSGGPLTGTGTPAAADSTAAWHMARLREVVVALARRHAARCAAPATNSASAASRPWKRVGSRRRRRDRAATGGRSPGAGVDRAARPRRPRSRSRARRPRASGPSTTSGSPSADQLPLNAKRTPPLIWKTALAAAGAGEPAPAAGSRTRSRPRPDRRR